MRIDRNSLVAAAVISLALGSSAYAADINISSVTSTGANPVTFTFQAGTTYTIQFIGTAQGGLYDAYNLNCPAGVCPASGWGNSFITSQTGDPNVSLIGVIGQSGVVTYSSALTSLAAYQSSQITILNIPPPYDGTGVTVDQQIVQPWVVTPDQTATINFFISDATRDNNVGGVSLRVTAGVPEPATWALLIGGFGSAGAMLRRRRSLRTA